MINSIEFSTVSFWNWTEDLFTTECCLRFTYCFGGHVRNSKRNNYSESLHLHDGGFSKGKTPPICQRWDPMCPHNFINLCLDLVWNPNRRFMKSPFHWFSINVVKKVLIVVERLLKCVLKASSNWTISCFKTRKYLSHGFSQQVWFGL